MTFRPMFQVGAMRASTPPEEMCPLCNKRAPDPLSENTGLCMVCDNDQYDLKASKHVSGWSMWIAPGGRAFFSPTEEEARARALKVYGSDQVRRATAEEQKIIEGGNPVQFASSGKDLWENRSVSQRSDWLWEWNHDKTLANSNWEDLPENVKKNLSFKATDPGSGVSDFLEDTSYLDDEPVPDELKASSPTAQKWAKLMEEELTKTPSPTKAAQNIASQWTSAPRGDANHSRLVQEILSAYNSGQGMKAQDPGSGASDFLEDTSYLDDEPVPDELKASSSCSYCEDPTCQDGECQECQDCGTPVDTSMGRPWCPNCAHSPGDFQAQQVRPAPALAKATRMQYGSLQAASYVTAFRPPSGLPYAVGPMSPKDAEDAKRLYESKGFTRVSIVNAPSMSIAKELAKRGETALKAGTLKAGSYLDTFFREKNLDERTYEVNSRDGTPNWIPSSAVIAGIKQTSGAERKRIEDIIRKIDFANGDVHHFLKHLAGAMAINQFKAGAEDYTPTTSKSELERRAVEVRRGVYDKRSGELKASLYTDLKQAGFEVRRKKGSPDASGKTDDRFLIYHQGKPWRNQYPMEGFKTLEEAWDQVTRHAARINRETNQGLKAQRSAPIIQGHEAEELQAATFSSGKVILYAKTRGGRYEIKVYKDGDSYSMEGFTRGQSSSRAVNYTKDQIKDRVSREIRDAASIDGINYQVQQDDEGLVR